MNAPCTAHAQTAAQLGDELLAALCGDRLDTKIGFTAQLLTCDETGFPHAAFLSVGEVIATAPRDLWIALHSRSRTTANLRRSPSATLVAVCDGVAQIVRVRCATAVIMAVADRQVACFHARVSSVEYHDAPYATGLEGIRFELRDPRHTLTRWEATIAALRRLAGGGESP